MADEIKPTTTPITETTPSSSEAAKEIEVDLFGRSVKLPLDVAKEIIAKRDERTKIFKDLDTKVKEYETKLGEATKRVEMAEKVKAGAFAEAEAIANKNVNEKLSKLERGIIQKELKSELSLNPEFIGGTAIEDALKLIGNEFIINDANEVVTKDGKAAKVAVEEFVKSRDNFRKTKTVQGTGATKTVATRVPQEVDLGKGIAKLFGK